MQRSRIALRVEVLNSSTLWSGEAVLDPDVMKRFGIKNGDLLVVEGSGLIAVLAKEGDASYKGKGVIGLDELSIRNLKINIGDVVYVERIERRYAQVVKLAPVNYYAPVDTSIAKKIKQDLISYPLCEGMEVRILMEGVSLPFRVISIKPRIAAIVTEETEVQVFDEPILEVPHVTFDEVGGLSPIIEKIREVIEVPYKYKKIFSKLGIDPPKGILLYGPPGCGKTLIAKALANELNAYFIAINGPEIMSKFYGESEQRLREIFRLARKKTKKRPAIIFIDEIDAIAPKRDEVTGDVEKRVVAQLLALMDGLESREGVIVVAATNRPNAIDPALRRPGRFDYEIEIPMPDKRGRYEILLIHTRRLRELGLLAPDVDLEKLAEITHGFTGADLAAIVKEAVMRSVKRAIEQSSGDEERVLSTIQVKFEDFLVAYKSIVPSGLREVYIEIPEVRFNDIGGLEEAKQVLRENVEYPLKHPDFYEKFNIKPPRGVLLYGPPGCGKTLLAKAIAAESGANFIAIRGPEILSKWVGESERAIREIFRKAKLHSPSVIFIDEVDAITSIRGYASDSGVTEKIVAQLITEMDGIHDYKGVVVLAATNRPDLLDPALLRPGRFDKLVYIPPPDYSTRLEILRILTASLPLSLSVNLSELAKVTERYSGADLEALVREAVMIALREGLNVKYIEDRHFSEALKVVKPSLNENIIRFYEEWSSRITQQLPRSTVKPPTIT
ncbi:MAG: CDC48 family AAA ATPase [Desulfurococcaceae archaeon]|nr:CDC48 family AAA ATPase [Desulfurococcaceae archaeon]